MLGEFKQAQDVGDGWAGEAEVARTYVLIRTLEERLRIAKNNVIVQAESMRIAAARFQGGATSERDVQQALPNSVRVTSGGSVAPSGSVGSISRVLLGTSKGS